MHCVRQMTEDLYYLGANDRRLELFENVYPIAQGISYNSYFFDDAKTVLLDTVDNAVREVFFANLSYLLRGRELDYVVVHHVEPDHGATLAELVYRYPHVRIITSAKGKTMIGQFHGITEPERFLVVKEGDTFSTGRHELRFFQAPMVHWPEVILSYDSTDKVLFSADAFGTFGALNGHIYADEYDFSRQFLSEARRYLTNIVGKYGLQITAALKKAATLDIKYICPLHGPIWRQDIAYFVAKYAKWGAYEPEDQAVVIAYGSIYGHTENAAEILAAHLADLGVKDISLYNVSNTHPSYVLSECFRASHLVFASASYNAGLFDPMQTLLHDLGTHNLKDRKVALIENGSWAPSAGRVMQEALGKMKGMELLAPPVLIKSAVTAENCVQLRELARLIQASLA